MPHSWSYSEKEKWIPFGNRWTLVKCRQISKNHRLEGLLWSFRWNDRVDGLGCNALRRVSWIKLTATWPRLSLSDKTEQHNWTESKKTFCMRISQVRAALYCNIWLLVPSENIRYIKRSLLDSVRLRCSCFLESDWRGELIGKKNRDISCGSSLQWLGQPGRPAAYLKFVSCAHGS